MADLPTLSRRRGVTRTSVTCLVTKVREAEAKKDEPGVSDIAQNLLKKLQSLDSDLKTHYSAIIDLVEKEDDLEREQDVSTNMMTKSLICLLDWSG